MKKLSVIVMASLLFVLGACGGSDSEDETKKEETKEELKANDVYEVPANPTNYQYELYNELTDALKSDDEAIAKSVVQNFSANFFTLKNKGSAEEVGGLTYLPEGNREDFQVFAMNYVYANYQTIIDEHGKESLPEVTKVEVDSTEATTEEFTTSTGSEEEGTYEESTDEYEGFTITVKITYADTDVAEDDLKATATFTVLKIDDRYEIIKMS